MSPKPAIAIISQVYVPDPTAVGQVMADAATELARRGFHVVVQTSRSGYDDPNRQYAERETIDGVDVHRLPFSSFGKRTILRRLLGAASFLSWAILRTVFRRHLDGVLVSTSPPMCSFAALVIAAIRRVPIVYWAMDINPDQAIALGTFRPGSLAVRLLDALNRTILRRAHRVVALDRFMAERLQQKQDCNGRMAVIPPWAVADVSEPVPHESNPFRREHGLDDKFVLMYSGNMSLAHPLDTILQAAHALSDRRDLVFLFVGGGLGRKKVEEFIARNGSNNVRLLPYQPLDQLRYSLSAADVHLLSMGNDMVGIVHPCKIYGAMECGRPVFLLGPRASHAGELIERYGIGWQVEHGDVDGAVATIRQMMAADPAELGEMGRRARAAIDLDLSKQSLCQAFCDQVETALASARFFSSPAELQPASTEPADSPAHTADTQGANDERQPAQPSARN